MLNNASLSRRRECIFRKAGTNAGGSAYFSFFENTKRMLSRKIVS